jgi:hypothetical protein
MVAPLVAVDVVRGRTSGFVSVHASRTSGSQNGANCGERDHDGSAVSRSRVRAPAPSSHAAVVDGPPAAPPSAADGPPVTHYQALRSAACVRCVLLDLCSLLCLGAWLRGPAGSSLSSGPCGHGGAAHASVAPCGGSSGLRGLSRLPATSDVFAGYRFPLEGCARASGDGMPWHQSTGRRPHHG